HVRRWTGRPDLGLVSCKHCHLQSLEEMPWAKARPHHASPAGIAVSPDGKKLYVALDDLDQVVEIDTGSLRISRKIPLVGGPFGLALDAQGERIFVTCRDNDKVVELDAKELRITAAVAVGEGPVAIAFCKTSLGDRLIVANSISDNVSVLALAP